MSKLEEIKKGYFSRETRDYAADFPQTAIVNAFDSGAAAQLKALSEIGVDGAEIRRVQRVYNENNNSQRIEYVDFVELAPVAAQIESLKEKYRVEHERGDKLIDDNCILQSKLTAAEKAVEDATKVFLNENGKARKEIAELKEKYEALSKAVTVEEIVELGKGAINPPDGYVPSFIEQELARTLLTEKSRADVAELKLAKAVETITAISDYIELHSKRRKDWDVQYIAACENKILEFKAELEKIGAGK